MESCSFGLSSNSWFRWVWFKDGKIVVKAYIWLINVNCFNLLDLEKEIKREREVSLSVSVVGIRDSMDLQDSS